MKTFINNLCVVIVDDCYLYMDDATTTYPLENELMIILSQGLYDDEWFVVSSYGVGNVLKSDVKMISK